MSDSITTEYSQLLGDGPLNVPDFGWVYGLSWEGSVEVVVAESQWP